MIRTEDIQQLNESLNKANRYGFQLTEQDWQLLSKVVAGALVIALLPAEAPVAASLGVAALTAIAGIAGAMGLATAIAGGTVLALNVFGAAHSTEKDLKSLESLTRLAGNPFSLALGTAGHAIDGDRGLEAGTSAGAFVNALFDANEAMSTLGETSLRDLDSIQRSALSLSQAGLELAELSSTPHAENVGPGQHIRSEHVNSESMTRDMLERIGANSSPMILKVVKSSTPKPSDENAESQTKFDRHFFDSPENPPYSPFVPQPSPPKDIPPAPKPPDPKPIPPSSPPAPQPKEPYPKPIPPTSFIPDYLGGSAPSEVPPPTPTIPDKPDDDDGVQLHRT